jgi:hypothetical protein
MKYQISNTASNPLWVDNYVLHHIVTPVHNELKATGQTNLFYSNTAIERNKMWVNVAKSVGIANVYLEDGHVWIDIPDTADTMVWMLKA